ncbi:MAG: tetratricopeptide repeat protein [Candidatus Eremiobacteraeota bacterium]|nr:tetratricopeptide repeat protein [Candidatus Eremiobacteraeota bacterium]
MIRGFVVACAAFAAVMGAALWSVPARAQLNPVPMVTADPEHLNPGFASDPYGAITSTRELIAEGKMNEAIKHLETYVTAHPMEPGPRRFLGDLYFRTGQLERAKFTYEELLRENPADKETHNRLGTVLAVQNDVDAAIDQFNKALPGTDSVDDLVALHTRKGDLATYLTEIDRLSKQYPTDPAIQGEVGQVFNALHQPYPASVHFRQALDGDPKNLTAINGLGLSLLMMHDYAGAVQQFTTCMGIDPYTYQCQNNLAATELESRQMDKAKVALDKAFHLAPERAETFVNYGFLADMQGDWQKAVSYYAQSIQMFPYLRESYIDLALAYEEHKMYPLAQAALIKGIASVNDDGRMHCLLGKAYEAQGDRRDAMTQYKLAEAGTDPDAARIAKAQVTDISSDGKQPQE